MTELFFSLLILSAGIVGFFHLGRFLGRLATIRLTLRFSPALYLIASGVVLAALFFLLPSPALVQAGSSYTGYSEYYIPGPAQQLWDIFQDIDNNPDLLEAQGLRTIIAVTASADATTLYYDHWEDGYEADPLNPVQASSEQYTINEGNVQRFEGRNIPIPRATTGINPALLTNCGAGSSPIANKCYDGRDRIYTAGGPVVVTAAYWPESIGTVFAQAWEILPTKPYRVNYTIPVGEDLAGAPTNYADFAKTYVIVQSAYNTNTVTIDDPGTAGIEVNVTLNEGEVAQLYHIDAGTVISSTLPVQVQFITGDGPFTGASSWINSYSALPSPLWDNEYYSPVEGFSNAGYDTDLYIYNPNPTPITVQYQDLSGSGSFNVPAYSTIAYSDPAAANRLVPNDSGVYLISTEKFWAIGTADTEDLDYDWGFDLVPAYILDDEYFLGWAPGSSNSPPTENGSPVFVTPVEDGTIVYVDYSPTNGTVDATYTLNRLQVQKIFDPDNDNTGMHIWATGPLALMWGEDADTAAIGTPYLDMGYTTLPLPIEWMDAVVGMTKTIEPSTLPPGAGQVATVTLAVPVYQLDSGDPFTMSNLIITDTLPSSWAYVTNSTTISLPTGVLANNPAIAGQNLTWNLSSQPNLNPNDMVRVIFQMQTMAGVPAGYNQNCAEASGVIAGNTFNPSDCDTVFIGPLTIDKDTSTPVVRAGQSATYTIVLNNIDNLAPLTNLVISDTLPGGFTYAASTVSSSGLVTRTATTTPAVGATTLSWGRWDIAPLAILTITLRVNIPLTVTADTYDNTARASTTQTGLVDDVGTAGQDNHTPSGQDPESDEDVTVVNLLLQKTSSAGGVPVNPGDTITYTIVITNPGTSPQTNIIVADALPIGTTYVPQSTSVVGFTPTVLLGTVGDAFNTNGVFTGNQDSNGATDPSWVGNWIEVGEADGAGAGDVQVVGNQLQIQDNDNGGEGVRRDVDLSSCNAATLSLVYRRVGLDDANDYVRLSIGSSGTLTDILTDFAGPTNDGTNQPYSADISRWLSNQTRIQLLSSANMGGSDQVFFDDVLIQCYIFPAVTNLTKDNIPGGVNSDLVNGVPSTLLVAADDFDLPANSVMTVTYRVTVTNPLPAGLTEIENIASVTSDQQLDPLQATVTDTIGVADLSIAKSDNPDPVTAGQVLTYTLTYTNNGPSAAQNVYITDTLPVSVTFGGLVSENPAMSGPTQTGRFLTWFTPTLAAGASGNLVFTVTVSSNVTQTITNSVSITTTTLDSNPNNNTDDEPTQVEPLATIGDFVWNDANGNGIQDAGETGISGITVTLYLGATPVQTVTTDASGLYTFTNVVSGTYSVQFTGPATYTFSAVDQGGNDNLDSDANPATGRTATFPVSAGQVITNVDAGLYQPADVTIVKVDDPDPVAAGGILTYTLVYTNNGPAAAQNVLLTDTLPASVTFGGVVSISPTLSGPTQTGQSLTWFTPTLAAGTSGGIVFTVTVDAAASGLITNSAVVTTTTPDGNPNNNSDTEPTTVFTPAIEIAKTPDSQMVVSGDTVTFTIQVTNTGDITLTNVTVSDPLVADCVATIGTLGPNETTSYTCTESNVTADFTNVATVTGTPPVGPDVSDNDDAEVDVITPAIEIAKTPDSQMVVSGDTVTFTIQVTNTGDITLTNVTVSDPLVADCVATIGTLGPNETTSYTCTESNVLADFTNVAMVTGTPPVGPDVSDNDDAEVDVITPAIEIAKTPDSQMVVSGDTVTFTIQVTNTGDITLTNVTVTDPLASNCAQTIGTLGPNETTSYTCTQANVTADFTNVAMVTGTPPVGPDVSDNDDAEVDVITPAIEIAKTPDSQMVVSGDTVTFTIQVTNTGDITLTNVTVSDPLVADCVATIGTLGPNETTSYTCTESNVTADFTNVATVTGTPPVGPDVSDNDDAEVDVITPAIEIAKTPDSQMVVSGDTVTFTIQVTNTGDITLTNVTVSDPLVADCVATIGTLGPNETTSYTCTESNVTADFTNVATVTGTPPVGPDVSDNDDAEVDVITPAIEIAKTPDSQMVVSGDTVTFTIRVTNTGDITLTNVTVSDPLVADCVATIGTLGPNETTSYTCTESNVTADFTNVATVTGTPPVGPDVSDNDDAEVDVITPAIEIAKTPDSQMVVSGDTVTFTIQVTNTGDITLTNVTVSDPLVADCVATIGTLGPNETTSYTCTQANVLADFTNVATVTGTPPVGPDVSDNDDAEVDVITPAIEIAKTPDSQMVVSGDTVTFTIQVTNTGDITLTNVTVSDPLVADCVATIGTLGPNETTSYTCTESNVLADFTNVAMVTGTPPVGPDVSDNDDAEVDVITPAIEIAKTPDSQMVVSGDTVTFTIQVTNTGDITLTNVTVSDPLVADCVATIGTLGPNETTSYTCTESNVTADFTNVATVTGTPPVGPDVSDNDDAEVDVITPAIEIAKTPDSQMVVSGDTVTFTIQVTNTGDITLTNVTVSDPLVADCVATIGTLGPNETTSYTCTESNVLADFTNVAMVTGTPPVGPDVSDNDDAEVDVITPAIEIAKTPDSQMVVSGDTVTFTIQVTNTGDITLTNVTVTDPLASNCAQTIGTLGPNETTSYTCTQANVTADFTNVAMVTGTPPVGPDVTDNDDAIVNVTLSGVSLTKTLVTADPVQVGDPIQFQIVIANIGNTTLTTVTLIDTYDTSYLTYNNASPASDNNDNDGSIVWTNIGPIAAGNSLTITVNFTAAASTQTLPGQETINEGRVSAIDQNNDPVPVASDTDTVGVINLGLAVDKSINIARVAPHQIVTYTITITNVGDVTLNPVRVTDTLDAGLTSIPGTATPPPSIVNGQQLVWNDITSGAGLAPQARTQITLLVSVPTITGTYGNLVVTTGDHPAGTTPPVTDRVSTHVEDPSIQVDKELNAPGVVGDLITFTIRITNTGPSVLDQIPLFDSFTGPVQYVGGMPRADTVDNTNRQLTWNDLTTFFGDLAPGQSAALVTVFRLTTTDSEFSMTNTARVTNADDVFNNVANEDEDTEVLTNVPTAVDLLYFTSQQTGNSVELLWATAVEYDNYGFRLLRSSTGNFADAVEIGFVPGQGQGTVSGTVYEFIDATVEVNQTYTYWLVDVDFNGVETSHSETTSISVTAGGGGTKIYLPRIFK